MAGDVALMAELVIVVVHVMSKVFRQRCSSATKSPENHGGKHFVGILVSTIGSASCKRIGHLDKGVFLSLYVPFNVLDKESDGSGTAGRKKKTYDTKRTSEFSMAHKESSIISVASKEFAHS